MAACVLFSVCAQSASVQSRIEYYDVSAHDLNQLRSQIQAQGPKKRGNRYSIAAEYHLSWTPKVQIRNDRCEALQPDLQLSADLVMPRWISQSKADFAVQQSWISYIAAAQQYHQKITLLIEQSVDRFVQQTRGLNAAECDKLEALINAKGRAALASAQQKVRTYQRQTRYGESLGLTIP
ncbi:hypothetical protein AHAT_39640 [Agarivorans sp. Toyoura001]|nr:hypothetical protein AHAT_39640 [Agarivorans sp. Toyoura001]